MSTKKIMCIMVCSFVSFLVAENAAISGNTITINTIPWGEEVYIDGKKIDQNGPETPIIKYSISKGKHSIEVKKKGYPSIKREVIITGDEVFAGRFSKNEFRVINGGNIKSAKNIALIIGHDLQEEEYYSDIISYVANVSEVDVVMLFNYKESNYKDELGIQLKSNVNDLFLNNRKLETVYYYHRNIGNQKELDAMKNAMSAQEKKSKALYMQACIFD